MRILIWRVSKLSKSESLRKCCNQSIFGHKSHKIVEDKNVVKIKITQKKPVPCVVFQKKKLE